MFKKARLKLTFFYSIFFLLSIWLVSLIIYFWMQHYFQQEYTHELQDHFAHQLFDPYDADPHWSDVAAMFAFNQFKLILFLLNVVLLLLVPLSAWLLTGRSLKPIEEAHLREKQFVANAAHDLRTPLTIMNGEMEIALQKLRKPKEYQEVIISSKEEVKQLISLVEDLLFLARQDASNQVTMIHIDVIDVLTEVVAQYLPLAKLKSIHIDTRLPDESITIQGNRNMLYQLFSNLVDNAIKYTPKGVNKHVVITVKKIDGKVVVSIADDGIGIPADDQKKIFDRFYRVDSSRSQIKGYGLGLSISQAIVHIHKGTILLASKPNHGTTFTVELPIR